jgi:UDP-N-acetylmuramoylalanine--D-glutamate ligase
MFPERVADHDIGIVGMARSGLAAASLARRHGGRPFVSDARPREELADAVAALSAQGIPFETGGHGARLLGCQYLVVSPGVKPGAPILAEARRLGLPVYSEVELGWWLCPCPVVAVTGSNGKTTTTALNAVACGNIGLAFADVADQLGPDSVAVVEMSSFQLATIDAFRPHVAVILNVSPDHLDWHGTLEAYRLAKHRVARNQGPADWLLLNADDPEIGADRIVTGARRLEFTVADTPGAAAFIRRGTVWLAGGAAPAPAFAVSDLRLRGRHNLSNAVAASLSARLMGAPAEAIAAGIRAFPGIEHRLEDVGQVNGVTFINDSKATNVDATCVALAAVEGPVHLILGGRDKGAPYEPIVRAGRVGPGHLASVVAIGEAAPTIEAQIGKAVPFRRAAGLEEAVRRAFLDARPGEVVLLSPACSSFDMFADFEERGRAFRAAVAALAGR